jgi:hypothetical protein
LEKLFSEKYSFDFDYSFDSIANTQIRGLGYTENVTINKNCEVHDFDFNQIVNVSKNTDNNDFVYVDSPLMDFISSSEHLETYLVSKGFSKDRKGRFLAPYQTTSQGSPVYKSDNGTLFLTPFSSSLQDVLGTDKPLHLRQLIMSLEGFETTKEANDFILGFFGIDVTWKKQTSDKNTFLGYDVEHFELSKNQFIGNVLTARSFKLGINILLGSTGTGKTNFTAQNFTKTIVVSRNITTLENYDKYGFERFLMKDSKNNFNQLQDGSKITVTYKSLSKLLKQLDTKDYVFIFDEYHLLTDSYDKVRLETQFSYNILATLQKTNIVILASANDVFISDKRLKIQSKHIFKKPSVKRSVKVTYNSIFTTLERTILKRLGEGRKVLLYTNRKEEKQLSELIKHSFIDNSILFFDATKHHINLENLQNDITVCTKALTTGKDVVNSDLAVIIYCCDYDMKRSVINQFFGRAREYKTASFDLLFTFEPDNEKYKKYDVNSMFFGCNEIAKSVISASVNDIAFLHENQRYFVAKENEKMTINSFAIDNHIETQISLFTLRNTTFLSTFLGVHGYECSITVETEKAAKVEIDKDALSVSEKYFNEIKLINDGNESDYIFETNAQNRVNQLMEIGFSKKESLFFALKFDSSLRWGLFVNYLLSEVRLETDNNFVRDYNKILECLNYEFLTALSITEKIKELGATRTIIGRDIKTIQKLDSEAANTPRTTIKLLRKYYEIKDKKTGESKTFLIDKTDFLTQKIKGGITAKDIKNLLKFQ